MLPRDHYSFTMALPMLTQEEHEKLFAAGYTSPAMVFEASKTELAKVLPVASVEKIHPKKEVKKPSEGKESK